MPFWLIVFYVAQYAFLPTQRTLLGAKMPYMVQGVIPAILGVGLIMFLLAGQRRRLVAADFLLLAFGFWGLLGMFVTPGYNRWKSYTNKFFLPMGNYYGLRLTPLNRRMLLQGLGVILGVVMLQSVLMILQRRTGYSPLYQLQWEYGNRLSIGPFDLAVEAAAFMCMWPALFMYFFVRARRNSVRAIAFAGMALGVFAVTCTDQRAGTGAVLLSVAVAGAGVFLCYPRFRRIMILLLVVSVALRFTSRNSGMVTPVYDRMQQTDQSRTAYILAGWEIVHSRFWDPLFGVGFFRAADIMPTVQVSRPQSEYFILWGGTEQTLAEVMESGHPLHDTFLSTLVETGIGAVVLGICLGLNLAWSVWRQYLNYRRKGDTDLLLVICLTGGILAWLFAARYHNGYLLETSLAVFWFLYGIVVGRPDVLTEPAAEGGEVATKAEKGNAEPLKLVFLKGWDAARWPKAQPVQEPSLESVEG